MKDEYIDMNMPSDSELQEIVRQVVSRVQGGEAPPASGGMLKVKSMAEVAPTVTNAVAIGCDHGGFSMKVSLIAHLKEQGYPVIDCGTHSTESVDYPDFALAVANQVKEGKAWRGIVIDGAGIGSCMAANKVHGVRAAMCYDYATAFNAREHNNANVLTLGAGLIGPSLAKQIVDTFLKTEFGGGRHARRVDKIMAIEEK